MTPQVSAATAGAMAQTAQREGDELEAHEAGRAIQRARIGYPYMVPLSPDHIRQKKQVEMEPQRGHVNKSTKVNLGVLTL